MTDCPICFESLNAQFVCKTPCGHEFCLKCILDLKDIKCPLCRGLFIKQLPKKIVAIWENDKLNNSRKKRYNNMYNDEDFPPLN